MSNEHHRIFLSPPYQSGKEGTYLQKALDSNYLAPVGSFLDNLEEKLEALFGYKEVIAVNSGTAALHLILRKLGIGRGDQVLVSNLTFIGGVSPIVYEGAEPVFVDSESSDWNISPELVRAYLQKHSGNLPKALIVVHLYGVPCDMVSIRQICDQYGVILIEDCAEAIGSKIGNQYAGTFGDYAFLSFNGNKTITTSGGGAVIANASGEKEHFIYLATQAKSRELHYEHHEIGFNYRLSNLLAALGLAQLEDLDFRLDRKKAINYSYREALAPSGFRFVDPVSDRFSSDWLTCGLVPEEVDPVSLVKELDAKYNIETRPVWKPMHMQPVFKNATSCLNGNSEQIFARGVCLPSGVGLTQADQQYVIQSISEIISR